MPQASNPAARLPQQLQGQAPAGIADGPAAATVPFWNIRPSLDQAASDSAAMDVLLSMAGPEIHVRAAASPCRGQQEQPDRPRITSGRGTGQLAACRPLLVILTVQAVLSARLLHANTAFEDEGLYLRAGHMEIAHWLHGTALPAFAAYFSGAPVIYPPLGALADSVGGLTGARVLSLAFMLGTTALLWGVTARLHGRRAAFFAAALFAGLGPTLLLGAFATFDAMSMFFVALAAWCVVHAGPGRDLTSRMLTAAGALALANATAYSSAIFDPVVVALAVLAAFPAPGGRIAIARGAALASQVIALLIMLITIAGPYYAAGIARTTLARVAGTDPVSLILARAWAWSGPVLALAAAAAVFGFADRQAGPRRLLLVVLAAAGFLVPIEQARIHTATSLDKHVDAGAWFAAIAAGYAADWLVGRLRSVPLCAVITAACAVMLGAAATLGTLQSQVLFDWPNAARFIAMFGPLAGRGQLLVETPSVAEYYLPGAGSQWRRWSSTWNVTLPSGRSIGYRPGVSIAGDPGLYRRLIANDYFSVVALNFLATGDLDQQIVADLAGNDAYRKVAPVPYGPSHYVIWVLRPGGLR